MKNYVTLSNSLFSSLVSEPEKIFKSIWPLILLELFSIKIQMNTCVFTILCWTLDIYNLWNTEKKENKYNFLMKKLLRNENKCSAQEYLRK